MSHQHEFSYIYFQNVRVLLQINRLRRGSSRKAGKKVESYMLWFFMIFNLSLKSPRYPAIERLWEARKTEPEKVHRHGMKECQVMYCCAVEPKLLYPFGWARPYSLNLRRRVKQHLWVAFSCPKFTELAGEKNTVHMAQTFTTQGLMSFDPQIELDISGEPSSLQGKKWAISPSLMYIVSICK